MISEPVCTWLFAVRPARLSGGGQVVQARDAMHRVVHAVAFEAAVAETCLWELLVVTAAGQVNASSPRKSRWRTSVMWDGPWAQDDGPPDPAPLW